jgi:hypothetical protein
MKRDADSHSRLYSSLHTYTQKYWHTNRGVSLNRGVILYLEEPINTVLIADTIGSSDLIFDHLFFSHRAFSGHPSQIRRPVAISSCHRALWYGSSPPVWITSPDQPDSVHYLLIFSEMPLAVGEDIMLFLVKEFYYTHQDQESFQGLKIQGVLFPIEFLHCFQGPVWNLFLLLQFLNSAKCTLYSYLPQVSADP